MDQDVERILTALQTMAGLLPAPWRPYVNLLFSVIGSLSVLLATVKGAMRVLPMPNAPDPKSGWGQWFAYWLIYCAEIPAFSFLKPVAVAAAEVRRAKRSKIPPPLPLFLLAVLCSSCATTHAVADATRAASDEIHDALKVVGDTLNERCKAAEARVFEEVKYKEDAQRGLAVVRAACDPLLADFEAARVLQVALASSVEGGEPAVEKALALLAAWQGLVDRARARGVVLAGPPPELSELGGDL